MYYVTVNYDLEEKLNDELKKLREFLTHYIWLRTDNFGWLKYNGSTSELLKFFNNNFFKYSKYKKFKKLLKNIEEYIQKRTRIKPSELEDMIKKLEKYHNDLFREVTYAMNVEFVAMQHRGLLSSKVNSDNYNENIGDENKEKRALLVSLIEEMEETNI